MSEVVELALHRRQSRRSAPFPPSAASEGDELIDVKLSFQQLVLLRRALDALRTLGAYAPQDELLGDTSQLVDLALARAV